MNERVAELLGLIEKGERGLVQLSRSLEEALKHDIPRLGRTSRAALIAAGLLENYYTCFETILLRVSQTFENHLSAERWHTDLLERMSTPVPGIRDVVVSEANFPNLLELLKFRHFRRYYFELEYDWDRLDFLVKKLRAAHPAVLADLKSFKGFLTQLSTD